MPRLAFYCQTTPPLVCWVQKEMIEDHIRTGKYFEAIMGNREQFKDRTVLDLGAGSGVLSIFAAKAGARKVYAVEATDVAKMAKRLVEHNKVRCVKVTSTFDSDNGFVRVGDNLRVQPMLRLWICASLLAGLPQDNMPALELSTI